MCLSALLLCACWQFTILRLSTRVDLVNERIMKYYPNSSHAYWCRFFKKKPIDAQPTVSSSPRFFTAGRNDATTIILVWIVPIVFAFVYLFLALFGGQAVVENGKALADAAPSGAVVSISLLGAGAIVSAWVCLFCRQRREWSYPVAAAP